MGSTPRMPPVSNEQYHIVLDYTEKHPELFFGKVTAKFTAQMKRALWTEIAEKLNNTGNGCQKTVGKWIQTWNLWKSTVKRRALTREKYQTKAIKPSGNLRALTAVEERCYSLILSNSPSCDSDDDGSKEVADTEEKNSLSERMDDTATQILDIAGTMEESRTPTNSPETSKQSSSLSENSPNSEKKPILSSRTEDSMEASTSDDSSPRKTRSIDTLRYSLPGYGFTPVARMRLSFAKRMRLTSAKRMRLSDPEKNKISGSRKMKATAADRTMRRRSEKMAGYAFSKLQETVAELVKKSAAERRQKYASDRMNPRVEIMKTFQRKMDFPHEEKQSAAETDLSKTRVQPVTQKNRSSVPEQIFSAERIIQNTEPERSMDVEPDKRNEVKKMADAVSECVHGTLSEDWKNSIVEKLKDVIAEKMTDVIAEKVRDAISDKVHTDISVKLKDRLSKLPKESVTGSSNRDPAIPTKGVVSAEVANAANGNGMNAGCIKIVDVRSVKVNGADGQELDKKSEELETIPTVVVEGHKESERGVKSRNIKSIANERFSYPELSDIKMEDNLDISEKGKLTEREEESWSDEEIFTRPPSKKRIKYTEDVIGELRLLQSSRLERLDSINRTLKTNARAMGVLSKTIDSNTDAMNNLAKAINNAGSLLLTSFD